MTKATPVLFVSKAPAVNVTSVDKSEDELFYACDTIGNSDHCKDNIDNMLGLGKTDASRKPF